MRLNQPQVSIFRKTARTLTSGDPDDDRLGYGWKEHRVGDTVFAWIVRKDAPNIPKDWKPVTVRRIEQPELFARIIEYGVRRYLVTRSFDRVWRGFAEGLIDPESNLLTKILPSDSPAEVGIFAEYRFQRCLVQNLSDPRIAFLTISLKHCWEIGLSVSALVGSGMDCSGLPVRLVSIDGSEHLSRWEGRRVGVISAVKAGVATIEDPLAPELAQLPSELLQVEGSMSAMKRYLQAAYPRKWESYWEAAQKQSDAASHPCRRLEAIESLASSRLHDSIPLTLGLHGYLRRTEVNSTFPRGVTKVDPSVFVFDYVSKVTERNATYGLRERGPYDKGSFSKRKPQITILYPRNHWSIVEAFFRKLWDGLEYPDRTKKHLSHRGFASLLRLERIDLRYVPVDNASDDGDAPAYEQAIIRALRQRTRDDLWFIVTEDAHRELDPPDDPYCVTKALLFAHGIPASNITIEEMGQKPKSLPFTLVNITLQAYAKMGGTPFVLKARSSNRIELVIGVGMADGPSRQGRSKLIGFTSAFRTNGDYLVGKIGPPAGRNDYVEEMARIVEENLADAVKREGASPGDQVHLVFHLLKRPGKDTELAAVEKALKRFTEYKVECAFVQVNESHPWLVIDEDDDTGLLPRTTLIRLDGQTSLLNMIGPGQYLKRGYPAPLLITVDKDSVNDVDRLAQQVFDFANVSWRGFNVGTLPVTILYAKLAAELAGKLSLTRHWKVEMIDTLLADNRWCL